jgi:hypothetical protein
MFSSRSRGHSACAVFTRPSSSCCSLIERLVRIDFAEHMLLSEQGARAQVVAPQLFHEFLVTVNDPVTSLILGGAYRSDGKEDQGQIRVRVSWDTSSARSVFRLPRQGLLMG